MTRTVQDPRGNMEPGAAQDGVRRRVESFGYSHVGRVRQTNEDHYVIASLQRSVQLRQTNLDDAGMFDRLCGPMAYLFAVADGVGGQAGGRLASGMAVQTIVEYLSETVGSYHGVPPGQEHAFLDPLGVAVQRAHETLLANFEKAGQGGPATTLTIALVVWPRAYIVHVGDSRAYHRRGGRLNRLTRDQTLGSYLVEQRAMSEQQVEKAGYHNVLTSAIGASDMTPVVGVLDLEPGDALLLCTDGLTNDVPEGEIDALLAGAADPERTCRALVDRALEGGGRDNITAIVAYALTE
jgi:PPM family protein phosphatase